MVLARIHVVLYIFLVRLSYMTKFLFIEALGNFLEILKIVCIKFQK